MQDGKMNDGKMNEWYVLSVTENKEKIKVSIQSFKNSTDDSSMEVSVRDIDDKVRQ